MTFAKGYLLQYCLIAKDEPVQMLTHRDQLNKCWYLHGGGGLVTQLCLTLESPWTVDTRLLCPWDFPGKNTGVGCHFLLYWRSP